jgi:tRNA-specific 2-thiouridylase
VGHLLKKEVRTLAKEINLPVATKKDSVGICFVGQINVAEFLKEQLGENPGEIITPEGKVIGQHRGLWFFTIGQRHGFEVNLRAVQTHTNWHRPQAGLPPLYVVEKKVQENQLVIGPQPEIIKTQFSVSQLSWINPELAQQELQKNKLFKVRIRHTGKLINCQIIQNKNSSLTVIVKQPVAGVAAGQFAVFYLEVKPKAIELINFTDSPKLSEAKIPSQQYICLGGGVIE